MSDAAATGDNRHLSPTPLWIRFAAPASEPRHGRTHIARTDAVIVGGQRCYTPNPWIGGALSLLLVGRLAWRWSQGALSGGAVQASQQASPLTMAFVAALIAYYLVNNVGLWLRMRALAEPAN